MAAVGCGAEESSELVVDIDVVGTVAVVVEVKSAVARGELPRRVVELAPNRHRPLQTRPSFSTMTSFYDADIDDDELLPSTCYHSWSDMDGTYVHRREYDSLRVILGTYAPIPCYLPPSFHQTVSRAARHLIDPFCTKGPSLLESASKATNSELSDFASLSLLYTHQVLLAVVALFRGRIALKQTTLKKTSVTSGDAVEHKVSLSLASIYDGTQL